MLSHANHQIVPDATNYKSVVEVCPRYRYLKLTLNNYNSGSIVLQPSSNAMLEFKLPSSDVINLSKSIVAYNSVYGAATNPGYNYTFEDVPELFNSINLTTSSGIDLVNLTAANNYLKIARRQNQQDENYLTADPLGSLYPSNALTTANIRPVSENVAANFYNWPASATQFGAIVNYIEPTHLAISAVEAGASQSAVYRARQYPLGMFKDSVLGMNKDLYLPTDTYLRINVSAPKMGFNSTSANAPTNANSTVLNSNLTLNNICLYVAVEQNALIVDELKAKFASGGLKMQIPYTYTFRNNTNGAGTIGLQIQFNRGYGKAIKKIMHTVWNTLESENTAFDCSNYNGTRISTYSTFLNSRKLQDQDLSCLLPTSLAVGQDDWMYNKKFYAKALPINGLQYQVDAWSHTDSFCEPQDHYAGVPEDNVVEGFPITEPVTWALQATAGTALNHYTFVTFLRDLHIVPSGNIVEIY